MVVDGQPDTGDDVTVAPAAVDEAPVAPALRHAVIVAGMHRSGTSALTRVLAYRGFGLPRTLVPANDGNELGHWESEPICAFNDRLLARAGQNWIGWGPIDIDWPALPDHADLVAEASSLILSEFGEVGDFVFKDPRLCRLLPFWTDVLARLGVAVMVVLAYRHPAEIGRSLERRNAIQPAYGMLAWLRFMLDAERDSRGVPRRAAAFDRLLGDWRGTTDPVAAWAALPPPGPEAEADVAAFLGSGLRHFADGDAVAALPAWVAVADRVFGDWADGDETPDVLSKLDAVAGSLDQAFPLFSPLVTPNDHVRRIEADLDFARRQLGERDGALAALSSAQATCADALRGIARDMERGAARLRGLAGQGAPLAE